MKERLSMREKIFCNAYVNCGNAKEAATSAGYEGVAQRVGERLLNEPRITEEIERLTELKKREFSQMAILGYKRLAFGSVADAVNLLYLDKPDKEQLEEMDLFMISEIKRPKEGVMEIKFFDRLKALEKLEQAGSTDDKAVPFYEALRLGAQAAAGITAVTEDEI